jgi:hypothetical protein
MVCIRGSFVPSQLCHNREGARLAGPGCSRATCPTSHEHRGWIRANGTAGYVNRDEGGFPQRAFRQGPRRAISRFREGSPSGILFKAFNWPPNAEKPSVVLEGISVGKDGILMCAGRNQGQCGDPKKPDDPIEFTVLPMKGEPSRFAFVSSDGRIGTVIVADPIEAKDKACTISLVRLTKAFDLAFLSGTGFSPNADIHYTVSAGMTRSLVIKSDSNGTIRVGIIPYPGKKKQGTASVKINEAARSPEAAWEWGPI